MIVPISVLGIAVGVNVCLLRKTKTPDGYFADLGKRDEGKRVCLEEEAGKWGV